MLVHICSYAPVFSPCSYRNYFNPFCQVSQLREERRWTCKRNKKEGRTQGRIVQIKCRHLMNQGSFNRSVFLHHTAQTCMYCIICYELCCTIFYFFLKFLKIFRFVHGKGEKKMGIQSVLELWLWHVTFDFDGSGIVELSSVGYLTYFKLMQVRW